MNLQKYDLITESTSHDPCTCLGKIISYIFSDQNIYIDGSFRKLLKKNVRGYIHFDDLLKQQLVNEFFAKNNVLQQEEKVYYVRQSIESCCSELYYNLGRVRRVLPFDMKKFKVSKPICIERIRHPLTIEDIREYFNEHVYTLNENISSEIDEQVLIYSQNYRQLADELMEKKLPFQILNYEQFYKDYDLSKRLKDKKLKALNKPIEHPRRMHGQRAGYGARKKGRNNTDHQDQEDDYEYEMFEREEMMRRPQRNNIEAFIKIGRQPNPEFNRQLQPLIDQSSIPLQ